MSANTCFHCGAACTARPVRAHEKDFCCDGCKSVYELLNEVNLCEYYDYNAQPGIAQNNKIWANKYAFLEDAAIKQRLVQYSNGQQTHLTFYLPQIHCSSCLWLLENIPKINAGILSCTVNFSKKEAFLQYDESKTSLRAVVETLAAIGYEPHLSLQDLEQPKMNSSYKHRLYKIGVAGFCFSNIMMLSFPEYLSVLDGEKVEMFLQNAFQYLIVGLSLPVFFYAATEFFESAWASLKNRFLNIDMPIAVAIVLTFGRSLYEIFTATGSGYLDSMSGIVFFMLIGRWLQDRTYQSISFDRDFKSFFPIAVNVVKDGIIIPTLIDKIRINDIIQLHGHELIPTDGILSRGQATIDYSFVSGESMPVSAQIGEIVYAGGRQMEGLIELVVVKEVSQSYLTNLWNKARTTTQNTKQNDGMQSFIHILSQYFTLIVFFIASIAAGYWWYQGQMLVMWNALTTILIVACPCALLLSANYTNGNILRILSQNKFYVRHPDVIEMLGKINHIVFDKTGTLTQSQQSSIHYEGDVLEEDTRLNLASLLQQSQHPLSQAVFNYLNITNTIPVQHFKTTNGGGISGWIAEQYIKVGSADFLGITISQQAGSSIGLMIDNTLVGVFYITNTYRFGIANLLTALQKKNKISVLSGDNDAEKNTILALIDEGDILFEQKPHQKLAYIQYLQKVKHQTVMMVGDGLNDAAALQQSDIGIAVTDNSNTFTPASDAIIDAEHLTNLHQFIQLAIAGKRIILFSFVISILYNIIGLYYAVQGILSPVIAAILMPCSSISIVFITYTMSEWAAWRLKLK